MFRHSKRLINVTIVVLVFALLSGFIAAPAASAKPVAPKNIIVMISDGWGFNHIQSASYYVYGKSGRQVYNHFPIKLAMSTYENYSDTSPCYGLGYDPNLAWSDFDYVNSCVTDSASAATAMSTGVKTYNGAIGVDMNQQPLLHAMQVAELKGKSTGVVTSVQFSHATPAGFVAHNISRNNYAEIANEMIYGSATDVIMGAGHPWFDDSGNPIVVPNNFKYVGGETTWADLVNGSAGNDADGDGDFDAWTLVQTRQEFQNLATGSTPERVMGVAQVYSTLQQSRLGDGYADPFVVPQTQSVPALEEMTRAALNILDNDPQGLFLMVEGGAVDWASHANQSGRMIEEQIEFDKAVQAVISWVKMNSNWGETLLIVTGDHETGYLNGPGSDPTWEPIVNNGKAILPGMAWYSGNHTNSLIPFFSIGFKAQWFRQYANLIDPVRGAYLDNTNIAQVIFQLLESQ
jgi:alkaline phosphatase